MNESLLIYVTSTIATKALLLRRMLTHMVSIPTFIVGTLVWLVHYSAYKTTKTPGHKVYTKPFVTLRDFVS